MMGANEMHSVQSFALRKGSDVRTRSFMFAALAAAMTLIPSPPASAQQRDVKAAEVLAAARKALGGEQKLASVSAMSLRATYRRELGGPPAGGGSMIMMMGPGGGGATQASGDLEIDVLFPDKYIMVDTGTGPVAITRTEGFDGDRPLLAMRSNTPHVRVMGDNVTGDPERAKVALVRVRADLARLLLGLTASTQPGFAVTYSYVGQAESPDGKAEVIDVKGADGFETRLFIDASTHLPLMLTYVAPQPRVVRRTMGGPGGQPPHGGAGRTPGSERRPPAELTAEERARIEQERKALEATPPKMIEHRLFFSDHREVDGVLLPHHIARGNGSTTTEEWEVKTYKLNPSFKANRFSVS